MLSFKKNNVKNHKLYPEPLLIVSFPGVSPVKDLPAKVGDMGLIPRLAGSPGREKISVHSNILAEKSHGQRGLVNYSPQGLKKSDTT